VSDWSGDAPGVDQQTRQESLMVRHLLEWRDQADEGHGLDVPTVRVDSRSVLLAMSALMLKCSMAVGPDGLHDWLHDRVAAADLNRRKPSSGPDAWVDVRSADRALAVLRYFVEHNLPADPEVYELAVLDFAAALAPINLDDYRPPLRLPEGWA
jgi:hypothetical protein